MTNRGLRNAGLTVHSKEARPSSPKYLFLENTAMCLEINPPLNKRKDFRIPIQDAHAAREDWHV